MTTIRQAFLKAADQIERENGLYSFGECSVPGPCGSPGCMLGWVGLFAGIPEFSDIKQVSEGLLGIDSTEFYKRIRTVSINGYCAMLNVEHVAHALRAYVDKYHPGEGIEEVRGIPDAVRDIFTLTNEQLREALDA